jgi:hypothetical protein
MLGKAIVTQYGSFEDNERLKELEIQKMEIENRAFVIKGSSLRNTAAEKIDSKEYESNLGIVHRVQQDLQLISDGMLNKRNTNNVFPRGVPRIVLFVDDLDRC